MLVEKFATIKNCWLGYKFLDKTLQDCHKIFICLKITLIYLKNWNFNFY